jgi:hypothetical protein
MAVGTEDLTLLKLLNEIAQPQRKRLGKGRDLEELRSARQVITLQGFGVHAVATLLAPDG